MDGGLIIIVGFFFLVFLVEGGSSSKASAKQSIPVAARTTGSLLEGLAVVALIMLALAVLSS